MELRKFAFLAAVLLFVLFVFIKKHKVDSRKSTKFTNFF